jgi:hypothetical protein
MKSIAFFTLTICLPVATLAKPTYVARIPNGANVKGVNALGHVDPKGDGDLNVFGEAFEDADEKWTKTLCELDSDNDGQTNGQELGDPCCLWTPGNDDQLIYNTGLSHPGLKDSKADESLWKNINCSAPADVKNTTNATKIDTPDSQQKDSAGTSSIQGVVMAVYAISVGTLVALLA